MMPEGAISPIFVGGIKKRNTHDKNHNVTTIRQPEQMEVDGVGGGRNGVHAERT